MKGGKLKRARISTVILLAAVFYFLAAGVVFGNEVKYEPTWESLDKRPIPEWWVDAKFGIFIHWGVYAVPSYHFHKYYAEHYYFALASGMKEVVPFHNRTYGEDFKYEQFAPMFKAEMFEPDKWAEFFDRAGAKYVVLTSKHHDGYCL